MRVLVSIPHVYESAPMCRAVRGLYAVRHPWLFEKLAWFAELAGGDALLQPNRYERDLSAGGRKAYVDGYLAPEHAAAFRGANVATRRGDSPIAASAIGRRVAFERALNPTPGATSSMLDSGPTNELSRSRK